MDARYLRDDFGSLLGHMIEECGEVCAAAGKTMRWGLESVNPELPPEQQETNRAWLLRELDDLALAAGRLRKHLTHAEHPARNVIQPAVGPAQDGAGADLPRSGIPPIDHDFVRNTWPKRDECDKRVSDDGRNSRQCGRPRREHQEPGGGK